MEYFTVAKHSSIPAHQILLFLTSNVKLFERQLELTLDVKKSNSSNETPNVITVGVEKYGLRKLGWATNVSSNIAFIYQMIAVNYIWKYIVFAYPKRERYYNSRLCFEIARQFWLSTELCWQCDQNCNSRNWRYAPKGAFWTQSRHRWLRHHVKKTIFRLPKDALFVRKNCQFSVIDAFAKL
jgi:hypothetical protein